MKWSVLATIFAAPLALAGALQADLVVRTDEKGDMQLGYGNESGSSIIVEEVVIIWVCRGGGSETTTMNTMSTVANAQSAAATHTVCSPCFSHLSMLM